MSVEELKDAENNGATDTTSDRDTASDRHSDADRDRSESVRSSIKSAWREVAGEQPQDRPDEERKAKRDDRPKSWEPKSRSAREAKLASDADARQRDPKAGAIDAAAFNIDTAPPAYSKEAKAAWTNTPEAVRQAAIKREIDTQNGIDQLRSRYAQEDAVWAAHSPAVNQLGIPRAEIINRALGWHSSLQTDPGRSYPQLIAAQNHDPRAIVAAVISAFPKYFPADAVSGAQQALGQRPQQQQQYQGQQQRQQGGIAPQVAAYINQHYGGLQQQVADQGQWHAEQTLAQWAKNKDPETFARVRRKMGELIQAGIAGLEPDGSISLDKAFDAACALDPVLSEKAVTDRIAQERKAASEAAQQARRSSASLSPGAPGRNTGSSSNKPTKGKSVGETLLESIDQARGGSRI
jgi:hypothetical protein